MTDGKPLSKKRKLESLPTIINADQIRKNLLAQNPDAVVEALNQLRKQLTIRSDEGRTPPDDERLKLAEQWLAGSPGAQDIFGLWENASPNNHNLLVAIVSVLGVLVSLLSCHYTYHTIGYPIVKSLLSPQWIRRLNSYIGGTHNELTIMTLKLLNAISEFAGGREKKSLLDAFQWEIKSLPKLLTLRRRGKVDYNPLLRPDIRILYILLLLSFLNGPTQVKTAFLEQHRDAFLAIFKGLSQDHYLVIRHVLEAIWTNLWSDAKVKRTMKVGLFNESTISHLFKIYERTSSDDDDPERIPADLVHHFLLAITTHPGTGICFKDKGWYPRDDTEDEKGNKIHNKILGNVLKTLKVNEDSRQQELARKVLEACPELVAGYWSSAQLTLEPRLSTKWVANIAFFGTIISLPVPQSTFYLPDTDLYNPVPPSLQTVLSNILPSDVPSRIIFTKGLQSQSGLVQHCTAQALVKCLMKFAKVSEIFRIVETALEGSDAEDTLWAKRRREIEKEVRRRVPEFQVVLGFSQQKSPIQPTSGRDVLVSVKAPNPIRNALIQESAHRLLLLYHNHLPEVVSEARFDVGKVLINFDAPLVDMKHSEDETPVAANRLQLVRKLHGIRTLQKSDQLVWTNKTPSSRTYLYAILMSYTTASVPALKSALLDLLSHLLSSSILFEENPDEPPLWFTSLLDHPRLSDAESPDSAKLTDEAESVVTFLDDCIQRSLKTPFRYIEEMHSVLTSTQDSLVNIFPSPLIMTLSEQFDAKIKAGLLTSSDVLAITSFIRRLIFQLMGQVHRLDFLEAFVVRMDKILAEDRLWPSEYPVMTAAVRTEVDIMYTIIQPAKTVTTPSKPNPKFNNYLDSIDTSPTVEGNGSQASLAYVIVDRLRFVDQPVPFPDIKRLILAVQSRYPPALQALARYLFPRCGSLWLNHALVGSDVGETIQIEWFLYNASKDQILDPDYRRNLVATFFSTQPNLLACIRLIRHLEHALDTTDSTGSRGLLSLLADLLSEARSNLTVTEVTQIKEALFLYPSGFKRLAMSHGVDNLVCMGLGEVIKSSFDRSSSTDSWILSDISAHRATLLQGQPVREGSNLDFAALMTTYLPSDQLFSLLAHMTSCGILTEGSVFIPLIQSILEAIQASTSEDLNALNSLWEHTSLLLRLWQLLPGSLIVEELILSAVISTLPVGISDSERVAQPSNLISFPVEMQRARSCWSRRTLHLDDFPIYDFINSDPWTPSTAKIIASLVYKLELHVPRFETWLASEHSTLRAHEDLTTVVQAALDVYWSRTPTGTSLNPSVWIPHLRNICHLCFDPDVDHQLCQKATSCMIAALSVFLEHRQELVQLLLNQTELRRLKHRPPLASILIGIRVSELAASLLDWFLHWLIGRLVDESSSSSELHKYMEIIVSLVHVSTPKVHQVETLLGVVVQHHLHHPYALELARACISKSNLKPVAVNRYLQSILHHPRFIKLSGGVNSNAPVRSKIVGLLHTLFNLYPTNTCQATQIEPLLRIYRGMLSKEDLLLFSIFQLFEVQRKTSLVSLFQHWSPSVDITCSSAWESLQTVDPNQVFYTTLHFPRWRKLNANSMPPNDDDCQLYDPVFLLLLHHSVLSRNSPTTTLGWIELFRTNIVGICIRALSSKDPSIRTLGLSQLSALYKVIENLFFQEKPHVIYIFKLLADLLPLPSVDDQPLRLPTHTTLMLSHALRGIFYPSSFIYPLTAKFLLQRPELDVGDVPMLYTMLYSNGDDWKKERGWIVRFIADGMVSSADWRVLKRRHVWDILASLFEGSKRDLALRKGVFEVLASLTSNRRAVTAMILSSSFLTWFEAQISQGDHVDEGLKWARLLANIVLTVDHAKLDSILKASWRNCIYRCSCKLLDKSNADMILPVVIIVVFGLSQSSETIDSEAKECIHMATRALELFETRLQTHYTPDEPVNSQLCLRYDPYPTRLINEPVTGVYSYATWIDCLTLLWRTIMASGHGTPWDELTFRLLASCSRGGLERTEAQWIRRQVVMLQGIYRSGHQLMYKTD